MENDQLEDLMQYMVRKPPFRHVGYDAHDGKPMYDRSMPAPAAKEPGGETAPAKNETAPAKSETPEAKPKTAAMGEQHEASGRTILQPSEDPKENQRLATEGHAAILPAIQKMVAETKGSQMAGNRPEKNEQRTKEKIEKENKPANTIPDYSAMRLSADSPQAKDELVNKIKDNFPVVREKDEWKKGSPGEKFNAHMLQVQSSNGATHEVQVLPKEVADIAESTHGLYGKARDGDKEAQGQLAEQNAAAMQKFNDRQERGEKQGIKLPAQANNIPDEKPKGNDVNRNLTKGSHVALPDGRSAKVQFYDDKNTKRARVLTEDGKKLDNVAGKDLTPVQVQPQKPNSPYVAFDLDKTLAHYDKFKGPLEIGKPIAPMIDKYKEHLSAGDNVKILTARVDQDPDGKIGRTIQAWLQTHGGMAVPVTNKKDEHMSKLYDDRAVSVQPNTGKITGGNDEITRAKDSDAGKEKGAGNAADNANASTAAGPGNAVAGRPAADATDRTTSAPADAPGKAPSRQPGGEPKQAKELVRGKEAVNASKKPHHSTRQNRDDVGKFAE